MVRLLISVARHSNRRVLTFNLTDLQMHTSHPPHLKGRCTRCQLMLHKMASYATQDAILCMFGSNAKVERNKRKRRRGLNFVSFTLCVKVIFRQSLSACGQRKDSSRKHLPVWQILCCIRAESQVAVRPSPQRT